MVGWGTVLQVGRSQVQFLMVSMEFFIDIILPAVLWPRSRLRLRNEYQKYFLGGKGGRCIGLTLPPSCADYLEIWQPRIPGTLRTCPDLFRDCFKFTFWRGRQTHMNKIFWSEWWQGLPKVNVHFISLGTPLLPATFIFHKELGQQSQYCLGYELGKQ